MSIWLSVWLHNYNATFLHVRLCLYIYIFSLLTQLCVCVYSTGWTSFIPFMICIDLLGTEYVCTYVCTHIHMYSSLITINMCVCIYICTYMGCSQTLKITYKRHMINIIMCIHVHTYVRMYIFIYIRTYHVVKYMRIFLKWKVCAKYIGKHAQCIEKEANSMKEEEHCYVSEKRSSKQNWGKGSVYHEICKTVTQFLD